MTSKLFTKTRDLSRARTNLTRHVIVEINVFIIESECGESSGECAGKQLRTLCSFVSELSNSPALLLGKISFFSTPCDEQAMEDRISDSADDNSLQPPPAAKPYLSFSIENILSEGRFGPRAKRSNEHAPKCADGSRKPSMSTLLSRLPWLAYTRYCPPKIPSK